MMAPDIPERLALADPRCRPQGPTFKQKSPCLSGCSRQHRPKPRAELAEVEAVDDAVAVEVEVAQIIRIAGLRSEGVPEKAEVEAVDGLIAVDVAEEAEEALRVV